MYRVNPFASDLFEQTVLNAIKNGIFEEKQFILFDKAAFSHYINVALITHFKQCF